MAINMCYDKYGTSAVANRVNADGFDANNLMASDLAVRRKGFRVEYFIRPPVEIVVRFDTEIDVMQCVIGLRLREHHVSGLEILTSRQTGGDGVDGQFELIAKHFTSADKICVRNVCFRPNGKLANTALPSVASDAEDVVIASRYIRHCYRVRQIKLKIIKTSNSSVPSLSCIDIWAQPNRSVSEEYLKILTKPLVNSDVKNNYFNFYDNSRVHERKVNTNKKRSLEQSLSDNIKMDSIPSEYIDPITNDIMTIPVLLPCGQNIDQSTLDKYLENESLWDRTPNDPFTKIAFGDNSKPTDNHELKLRIEQFLSQNYDSLGTNSRPSKRIPCYALPFSNAIAVNASRLVVNERLNNCFQCSECGVHHDSQHIMHKLKCDHVICRAEWLKKLNNKQNLRCSVCQKEILTKDVIKLEAN